MSTFFLYASLILTAFTPPCLVNRKSIVWFQFLRTSLWSCCTSLTKVFPLTNLRKFFSCLIFVIASLAIIGFKTASLISCFNFVSLEGATYTSISSNSSVTFAFATSFFGGSLTQISILAEKSEWSAMKSDFYLKNLWF